MKVLFIGYTYLNLYKDIIDALNKKGYEVQFIEDVYLKYFVHSPKKNLKGIIKKLLWNHKASQYWSKILPMLDDVYTNILILQGVSLNNKTIKKLHHHYPNAKISFITWDSINFYNSLRFRKNYINFFTFDIKDAKNYKLNFLPIYWINKHSCPNDIYRIFGFGSDHDDRMKFYKKILNELPSSELPDLIKIYNPQKECDNLITNEPISTKSFLKLINESEIILDDCRKDQVGLTARFMWALGLGKKIITTNNNSFLYPFVNREQVLVIDKDNPIITEDFLKKKFIPKLEYFTLLNLYEINSWVDRILNR